MRREEYEARLKRLEEKKEEIQRKIDGISQEIVRYRIKSRIYPEGSVGRAKEESFIKKLSKERKNYLEERRALRDFIKKFKILNG